MTANVRASSQQKIRSKPLHIVEIMHVVQRLSAGKNLIAGGVNHLKVTQYLRLKGRCDVIASFTGLSWKRVFKRFETQLTVQWHPVKSVHRIEQKGRASKQSNKGPIGGFKKDSQTGEVANDPGVEGLFIRLGHALDR